MPDERPCKHCGRRGWFARGLCQNCYFRKSIRSQYPLLYPALSRSNLEEEDFCGGYDMPDEPTDAPPGSREKVAVLRERAARRTSLWHPDDNPRLPDSEPNVSETSKSNRSVIRGTGRKLRIEDARAAEAEQRCGVTMAELARKYGVVQSTIWKHIKRVRRVTA